MLPVKRRSDPHQLMLGMTGVALGDRVLQVGCARGDRFAALAGRAGLSGRATVAALDDPDAARATKGAAAAGVFVEVVRATAQQLPFDPASFDITVIDDTEGLLGRLSDVQRGSLIGEIGRVLRPGGRTIVVASMPPQGWRAWFGRASRLAILDAIPLLAASGFTLTRVLGEREGLRFVEGVRPRRG